MTTALAPRRYRPRLLRSGDTLRGLVRGGDGTTLTPLADLPAIGPVTISALPQVANLLLYQGDTFFLDITLWDPEGLEVPVAQLSYASQIRAAVADNDPIVLAEFTSAVIGNNQIRTYLSHEDTTPLHGAAVWDAQITDLNGWVTTLAAGTVHITQEVTR